MKCPHAHMKLETERDPETGEWIRDGQYMCDHDRIECKGVSCASWPKPVRTQVDCEVCGAETQEGEGVCAACLAASNREARGYTRSQGDRILSRFPDGV